MRWIMARRAKFLTNSEYQTPHPDPLVCTKGHFLLLGELDVECARKKFDVSAAGNVETVFNINCKCCAIQLLKLLSLTSFRSLVFFLGNHVYLYLTEKFIG